MRLRSKSRRVISETPLGVRPAFKREFIDPEQTLRPCCGYYSMFTSAGLERACKAVAAAWATW